MAWKLLPTTIGELADYLHAMAEKKKMSFNKMLTKAGFAGGYATKLYKREGSFHVETVAEIIEKCKDVKRS